MVTRKFPRYPTQITSILMQRDRLKYNASIRDVSVKGCRVESVIKPFTGMQLEVSLQLPGEATPIIITNAAVRWTGSHGIGIDYSQSGLNGPSIFPVTSTAARLRRLFLFVRGPADRLYLGRGRRRCFHCRATLRRRHPAHEGRHTPTGLLARAIDRL